MQETLNQGERAEISELNQEIKRLTGILEESETERLKMLTADPADPFDNPTEYHEYGNYYSEIRSEVGVPGFKPALDPPYPERSRIKKYYSIAGFILLAHFLFTNFAVSALITQIAKLIRSINGSASADVLYTYIKGSSILASLNLVTYIVANVGLALIGLKLLPTKLPTLFKTRDYGIRNTIQYCFIAMFIFIGSTLGASFIENIFSKFGYTTQVVDTSGFAVSKLGYAIMLLYTCVIAPLTEEFFYRGMLLRAFSAVNQRFAIFATALFFGLGHKNIPQFVLAFLTGIFLAHITLKHGSMIPAVIVHIFINSMSEILSLLDLSDYGELVLNFVMDVAAVLGVLALLMFRSKDKMPLSTPAQSRRGLPLAMTTIGCIFAFGAEIAYMFLLIFTE